MNQPNVYGMYTANGSTAGFWIRRNSWSSSTYARVLTIAGYSTGPLPGKPPYHGNPQVVVEFYFNDRLKEQSMILSCPGTYGYAQIEPPAAS